MKFWMNTLTALSTLVALTACQGQNPFHFQANPAGQYSGVTSKATVPYSIGNVPKPLPEPDNSQQICGGAFEFSIDNDQGSKLMTFKENTTSSYTIHVVSYLGNDFTMSSEGPAGSQFTQIGGQGNEKIYRFSWNPDDAQRKNIQVLTLVYSSSLAQKCGSNPVDKANLEVTRPTGEPTVIIAPFPQTPIPFGESKVVKFKVQVDDPSSTLSSAPIVDMPTFLATDNLPTHPVLDASKAVDCGNRTGGSIGKQMWQLNCALNVDAIPGVESYIGKGQTVEARFALSARSTRSGQSSDLTDSQSIFIQFAKAAPVVAAPVAAPVAQKAPVVAAAKPVVLTTAQKHAQRIEDIAEGKIKLTKKEYAALSRTDKRAIRKAKRELALKKKNQTTATAANGDQGEQK